MKNNTVTLLNGNNIELFSIAEEVRPCADSVLFAENANLFIANSDLIFADSSLFLSPIDMGCGLAYCGKFAPATLGAYLEWWINYPESHDKDGFPVLHLAGSPLSGANRCTSVGPDGARHSIVLGDFSGAWHSFLEVSNRYRDYMAIGEAYPLERVIEIVATNGVSKSNQ